ncbi:MAG: type I restriction enzyme HsdR N-terminal domain-containing protein [Thermodesulfovibrionales bacterium]
MDYRERQKMIEERIQKKEREAEITLDTIREIIREFLFQKGYSEEEIETDRAFDIELNGEKTPVSSDFIIKIKGKRLMVIKCSPGALDSRQRHIVSFARVVDSYQIPLAVATDGLKALIFDTLTGRLLKEGLDSIPSKVEAEKLTTTLKFIPFPSEKLEREKRVLLAFEAIRCTQEFCE